MKTKKKESKLWIVIISVITIGLLIKILYPRIIFYEYNNKNKDSKWVGAYQAEVYIDGKYNEELSQTGKLCLTPSSSGSIEIDGENIPGTWTENKNQILITKANKETIVLTKNGEKIIYEHDNIKAIFYR